MRQLHKNTVRSQTLELPIPTELCIPNPIRKQPNIQWKIVDTTRKFPALCQRAPKVKLQEDADVEIRETYKLPELMMEDPTSEALPPPLATSTKEVPELPLIHKFSFNKLVRYLTGHRE